jgi:O-antigen/teichoic acid export membrane protein
MKKLGKSAATLAGAQVGGQVIGLVMLTIVARKIGPAYLGAYAFSWNVVAYVGLAATLGLPVLGMRDVSQEPGRRRHVLIDTLTARFVLAAGLAACLVAVSSSIAPTAASRVLLPVLAFKLVIDALTFDWYLQGCDRHSSVAASRLIGQFAYALVLLPLLAGGLAGARNYVIANLAGLAVTASILGYLVIRDIGAWMKRPRPSVIGRRVRRSTPFLWWIALTQVYYSTDLILVAYLAGDREAGLYAAAAKLPLSIIGVASLWFTVSMPETARLHSASQLDVIRRQVRTAATTAIVIGLPFILLGPIFATDVATVFFGPKFSASGPALAILSMSVAVSLLQIVITSVVMGAGRERSYVFAMSLGAAANVGLNLVLIPVWGIVGAAAATIAAETIVLAAGIVQLRHLGGLQVGWRAIREAAGLAGVAALAAFFVRREVGFLAGAVSAVAVYATAVLLRTARDPRWLNVWLGGVS